MADRYDLRLPAIEIRQGPTAVLYTLAVDGKLLPLFTTVSRVHRDDDTQLHGYQRPEVLAHIAAIRRYIESEGALVPNALVVAFDRRARFEPALFEAPTAHARPGVLVIPVDETLPDEAKPGWLVDGQQRAAAIRDADVAEFPVCISAFITDSQAEQRAQFILVNSTKPLPKGLIHELLPTTDAALPDALVRRRFPAYLLERLNYDPGSPFHRLIRTPTTSTGIVKDNSVLRMLEHSLHDGALYRFRDPRTGEGDAPSTAAMLALLTHYWQAVAQTFPHAWGVPPRRSRLMHGVGIVAMGFLMDAIADTLLDQGTDVPSTGQFVDHLALVAPLCRWTEGMWAFSETAVRKWNDLQNTTRDIHLLTNYLLGRYRASTKDYTG